MAKATAQAVGRRASIAAVLLAVVVSACGPAAAVPVPFLDLSDREAMPSAVDLDVVPLRVAVAAVLSPEGTVDSYAGLVEYLGSRLGRPTELIQRRTYAEVNELVAAGEVDVAFVCTSAYVAGHDRAEMELLVVPEIGGESVYHSVVIVPATSDAESIADLRGSRFAFTDSMSFTGRVYPTHLVQLLGETPEMFFSSVFFTYSHDRAIHAVADGVADGAAVDSLVLDYAIARDPVLGDRVKVIQRSPAFGIPPVVVPADLSPRLRYEIADLLLGLDSEPAGREVLLEIGVDRFVPSDDAAYEGVRALVGATGIDQ